MDSNAIPERADITDAHDRTDPTAPNDKADSMLPTERVEPIVSTDPRLAMRRNDSSDHRDQRLEAMGASRNHAPDGTQQSWSALPMCLVLRWATMAVAVVLCTPEGVAATARSELGLLEPSIGTCEYP